ncbi:MAG: hypothetical protein MHMPM18_002683 [Marteilia pararefringens]
MLEGFELLNEIRILKNDGYLLSFSPKGRQKTYNFTVQFDDFDFKTQKECIVKILGDNEVIKCIKVSHSKRNRVIKLHNYSHPEYPSVEYVLSSLQEKIEIPILISHFSSATTIYEVNVEEINNRIRNREMFCEISKSFVQILRRNDIDIAVNILEPNKLSSDSKQNLSLEFRTTSNVFIDTFSIGKQQLSLIFAFYEQKYRDVRQEIIFEIKPLLFPETLAIDIETFLGDKIFATSQYEVLNSSYSIENELILELSTCVFYREKMFGDLPLKLILQLSDQDVNNCNVEMIPASFNICPGESKILKFTIKMHGELQEQIVAATFRLIESQSCEKIKEFEMNFEISEFAPTNIESSIEKIIVDWRECDRDACIKIDIRNASDIADSVSLKLADTLPGSRNSIKSLPSLIDKFECPPDSLQYLDVKFTSEEINRIMTGRTELLIVNRFGKVCKGIETIIRFISKNISLVLDNPAGNSHEIDFGKIFEETLFIPFRFIAQNKGDVNRNVSITLEYTGNLPITTAIDRNIIGKGDEEFEIYLEINKLEFTRGNFTIYLNDGYYVEQYAFRARYDLVVGSNFELIPNINGKLCMEESVEKKFGPFQIVKKPHSDNRHRKQLVQAIDKWNFEINPKLSNFDYGEEIIPDKDLKFEVLNDEKTKSFFVAVKCLIPVRDLIVDIIIRHKEESEIKICHTFELRSSFNPLIIDMFKEQKNSVTKTWKIFSNRSTDRGKIEIEFYLTNYCSLPLQLQYELRSINKDLLNSGSSEMLRTLYIIQGEIHIVEYVGEIEILEMANNCGFIDHRSRKQIRFQINDEDLSDNKKVYCLLIKASPSRGQQSGISELKSSRKYCDFPMTKLFFEIRSNNIFEINE